jgi:hypothetical protein
MAQVRFTGDRHMAMTYDIYVDGIRYNARGYRFGARPDRQTATMTQAEADVLTGAVDAVYAGDTPITAVVPRGGNTGGNDAWELVGEA